MMGSGRKVVDLRQSHFSHRITVNLLVHVSNPTASPVTFLSADSSLIRCSVSLTLGKRLRTTSTFRPWQFQRVSDKPLSGFGCKPAALWYSLNQLCRFAESSITLNNCSWVIKCESLSYFFMYTFLWCMFASVNMFDVPPPGWKSWWRHCESWIVTEVRKSNSCREYLIPMDNIMVLDWYFNLTKKSNLIRGL